MDSELTPYLNMALWETRIENHGQYHVIATRLPGGLAFTLQKSGMSGIPATVFVPLPQKESSSVE